MLVRLGLLQPLLGPCFSSYLYAGHPERYPLPEKALAVPRSTEADMLAPDVVAAIYCSQMWSGYQEAIFPTSGGQLTADLT